jgi:hypothetical protein
MAHFIDRSGVMQHVTITPDVYKAAQDANLSVGAHINRTYDSADLSKGSAYNQIKASLGLTGWDKTFGIQAPTVGDILEGKCVLQASGMTQGNNTNFGGTESRTLFPATIVDMMEVALQKDRTTDANIFDNLVALTQNIGGDKFEQPIITYDVPGANGPEKARSARVAQFAGPSTMIRFGTSDVSRRIPTVSIGLEISDQALRSTPLDLIGLTLSRFNAVERDGKVYENLADMINGDADINSGAIANVTSTALDAAATGGVMTHKAWIKFLYRRRRERLINYVCCDLDTYLKIEGRTGRPGSNNYDPTLARVDVQATAMNTYLGSNVQFFIVDSAVDGGPVAANTIVAVDSRFAIAKAVNIQANYSATEQFALRQSQAMRIDSGEIYYRLHDTAWDSLTIA